MNAAKRLSVLLEKAYEYADEHPTAQTYEVWSKALGRDPRNATFLAAIAQADSVVDDVIRQVSTIDDQLLASVQRHLLALHESFALEALVKPWRTTIRPLGPEFKVALQVCLSTLASRVVERELTASQVSAIRAKLENLRHDCVSDDLPFGLVSYLTRAIDDLESALDRYWLLGPDYLAKVADSVVGAVGRELNLHPQAAASHVSLVKRLGSIAGALAVAVTLAQGAVQAGQATAHVLPWGDKPNRQVIECVISSHSAIPAAIPPQAHSPSVESPNSPASHELR